MEARRLNKDMRVKQFVFPFSTFTLLQPQKNTVAPVADSSSQFRSATLLKPEPKPTDKLL